MIIHSHHIDRNRQKSDKSPLGAVPAATYNSPNLKKHWTFAFNTLILLLKHLNLISTAYAEL